MKPFIAIILSILLITNPAFALLMRSEGVNWDTVERLRAPLKQLTKLGDKQYRVETGNGNRLANPSFQATPITTGWTVTTATSASDDTFYFEPSKSLQLTLPAGTQTNLDFLSQTYTANSGDMSGANLEVSMRIAKSVFQAAVNMQLCLDIDGAQKNCVKVPQTTAATFFDQYFFNFPAKQSSASVTYRVYLRANYSGVTGSAAIINVQDAYFGPARNIGTGVPPNTFTAKVSTAGVVSDETGEDWLNGNFAVTDTSLFTGTFVTSKFSVAPTCTVSAIDPDTTVSVDVRLSTDTTTTTVVVRTGYSSTSTSFTKSAAKFSIRCSKTGADETKSVITPNMQPENYQGTMVGTGWSTSSGLFADFAAGSSITLTKTSGDNLTVSAIAGSLPGITWSAGSYSSYQVCATVTITNSTAGQAVYLRAVSGTAALVAGPTGYVPSTANYSSPATMCGIVSGTGTLSVKLQGAAAAGTASIIADASRVISWTVVNITRSMNVPILFPRVIFQGINTAGTTLLVGSDTNIPFSTVTLEGGSWSGTVFTVTEPGVYSATCQFLTASPRANYITIKKNSGNRRIYNGNSLVSSSSQITRTDRMEIGDTYQCQGQVETSTTTLITSSDGYNTFSIVRVGN